MLSKYSNGFCLAEVLAALEGRHGWLQDTAASAPVLSDGNKKCTSGRSFNAYHALCTTTNLRDLMENPDATDEEFNAWLAQLQRDVLIGCMAQVFRTPEALDNGVALHTPTIYANPQLAAPGPGFHGYRIRTAPDRDISVRVDSVSLAFDQDLAFKLYLFHSANRSAPVLAFDVQTKAGQETVADLDDAVLGHYTASGLGGEWYLGYFGEDVGEAKAFVESRAFYASGRCFSADGITAPKDGDTANFARAFVSGSGSTQGLNVVLSSFKDYTRTIRQNAHLFDEVTGLAMAQKVVEMALYSVRQNGTDRILRDQLTQLGLQQEATGAAPVSDAPRVTGLSRRVEKELERLRDTFFNQPRATTYSTR